MESRSATIHRKMPIPARQLPITESAHKARVVGDARRAAIVAGFHVEYSGVAFAVFFLAEYMNMILISALCALMFLGGWLAPWPLLNEWQVGGTAPLGDGFVWLAAKMSVVLFFFLWVRASFPRYRYDQVMRLGWKVFIPVTLVWIAFLGAMMQTRWAYLFH